MLGIYQSRTGSITRCEIEKSQKTQKRAPGIEILDRALQKEVFERLEIEQKGEP